jgi:hypothetical protein
VGVVTKEVLVKVGAVNDSSLQRTFLTAAEAAKGTQLAVDKVSDSYKILNKSAAVESGMLGRGFEDAVKRISAYDAALKQAGVAGAKTTRILSDGFGNMVKVVNMSTVAVKQLEQEMKTLAQQQQAMGAPGGPAGGGGSKGGGGWMGTAGAIMAGASIGVAGANRVGKDMSSWTGDIRLGSRVFRQSMRGGGYLDDPVDQEMAAEHLGGSSLGGAIRSSFMGFRSIGAALGIKMPFSRTPSSMGDPLESQYYLARERRAAERYGLQGGVDTATRPLRQTTVGLGGLPGYERYQTAEMAGAYRGVRGDRELEADKLTGRAAVGLGRLEDVHRLEADRMAVQRIQETNTGATAGADIQRQQAEREHKDALKETAEKQRELNGLVASGSTEYARQQYLRDQILQSGQRVLAAENAIKDAMVNQGQVAKENAQRMREFAIQQEQYYRSIRQQEEQKQKSIKEQWGLMNPIEQGRQLELSAHVKKFGLEGLSGAELEDAKASPFLQDTMRRLGRERAERDPRIAQLGDMEMSVARGREAEKAEKQAIEFKTKIEAEITVQGESLARELETQVLPRFQSAIQLQIDRFKQAMESMLQQNENIRARTRDAMTN